MRSEPTHGGRTLAMSRRWKLLRATKLGDVSPAERVKQRKAGERKDSVGKPVELEHDRRHERLRDPADGPGAAQDERGSHTKASGSSINLRRIRCYFELTGAMAFADASPGRSMAELTTS